MWRRKNEEELKSTEKLKRWRESGFNPTKPAKYAAALALLWAFIALTPETRMWRPPISFGDAAKAFPGHFVILFALIYGLFIAMRGQLRLSKPQPATVICNKCFQVQAQSNDDTCPCGGKFELLELWTWIKEEENGG